MNVPRQTTAWAVAGQALPHESALGHVQGSALYVDDIPEQHGTYHAALGLAQVAHGHIRAMSLDAVRASPGVIAVLVAADIPGVNDCGPILHDDPILADGTVEYVGHPVFVVVASSHDAARRAARLAQIEYEVLPPLLDPIAAREAGALVLPALHLRRGDAAQAHAAAARRIDGTLHVGGQEQFYLEGQIAYALPQEAGAMLVYCSTQHPSEMQHVVAQALGLRSHDVRVECRRMGGGFGGKESQSAVWAALAAICAAHLRRPVKLRADRDDDMLVTGKRHCCDYRYAVGFDDDGRISALQVEMVLRAGYSADLSGPVATRAICHVDNAYYLSDVALSAWCARTHTQSNTAFRGFGGPQGAIVTEYALDDIARVLGRDPLDIRRRNLYAARAEGLRDTTPYGQRVDDNVLHDLLDQLELESDYRARRRAIAQFNAKSPILKKGLALTPVKFGIAFNVNHLNQAGALVHVYVDGSVMVSHGGTEMGQGLHTKVMQVVAQELGISLGRVRIAATDTSKVPNTSATAASTGADLNGKAAQAAARTVRERLIAFAVQQYGVTAEQVMLADDQVVIGQRVISFPNLVRQAYLARVQLWSDGFYATPDLAWDAASMTGHPFSYFAYGAAVAEVLIDTLTGESSVLRVDILHDV
ncbi:MAG: xanthine dehydrogenase molybdopterin binding subunit, partial [Pseudomonadota bacterium]|nr:xanthine dehydrogenase molybdopterin binding subunit [Pseudomonadota bacterium]